MKESFLFLTCFLHTVIIKKFARVAENKQLKNDEKVNFHNTEKTLARYDFF